MKSRKKLVLAGCAVTLTLTAVVVISTNKKESTSILTDSSTVSGESKSSSKKKFTREEVKTVYQAIKENKIAPFIAYVKEGGDLSAVVTVEGKEITLAQAIVKHERLEFVHQVATHTSNTLKTPEYNHESADIKDTEKKSQLSAVATGALSASANQLVPVIAAISKMGKPAFKKELLGLTKSNPDVLSAAEVAASEVLPQAVETCDQDQIRFLGDLGADPMAKNNKGANGLDAAGKTKCFKAISYWKKEQNLDFLKKNDEGVSGFDVLAKFKDPELQSFTDNLQEEGVREIASLKPKVKRVSFYKKRVTSGIIDPEALVEPELRPDEATETAEFSEFSD